MDRTFPNIGITYDPSHYVMQGISLLETKEIVSYSHNVHIRNARQGAEHFVTTGEGAQVPDPKPL